METRLVALTAREPSNVDALILLGKARYLAARFAELLPPLDRAAALDPTRADALHLRALAYAALGQSADALDDFTRCIATSPGAASCFREINRLQANDGQCAAAESTARAMIKIDPSNRRGYSLLASALYGERAPIESVRLALDQCVSRSHDKAMREAELRFKLATLEGRFDAALAALSDWEAPTRQSSEDATHVYFIGERVAVLIEIQHGAEAAALVREYARNRAAYTPDPVEADSALLAPGTLYLAGELPRDAFVRQRSTWLSREWQRLDLSAHERDRFHVWFEGYASNVKVAKDARDSVLALAQYAPLPDPLERDVLADEALGRVFLGAGNVSEALAPLRRAAASCLAIDQPLVHTRALAELGEAAAKLEDKATACPALRAVLDRWGTAAPPSSTAARARTTWRALGCP